MEQIADKFQSIVLEDIRNNPQLLMGIIFNDKYISLILEKRGNTVRYAYLRTYSSDRWILHRIHHGGIKLCICRRYDMK